MLIFSDQTTANNRLGVYYHYHLYLRQILLRKLLNGNPIKQSEYSPSLLVHNNIQNTARKSPM